MGRCASFIRRHYTPFVLVALVAGSATSTTAQTECTDGFAGVYPCHQIDLISVVTPAQLGVQPGEIVNDLWGWTDPMSGREYAVVGLSNGTAFVDLASPAQPVVLGRLPTRTVSAPWRDVKVYGNHALVVADGVGPHGMQVFDLTELRNVPFPPVTFQPTALYFGEAFDLGSAHNIAVGEGTGYVYVVGSGTCGGGLHVVDVSTPDRPAFAGCFAGGDYTHDAQCVVYRGPDSRFNGSEICFNSNEDSLSIVDVTNKSAMTLLSRTGYPGWAYTHQSWLTEDHRYLLLNDELDEQFFGHGTRTYIWDVSDLRAPEVIGTYTSTSSAVDHNLYIRDGLAYLANYTSGLRILDLAEISSGVLSEVAFFDIVPTSDAAQHAGAWSVYPFLSSGYVTVTGTHQGLFVLRPRVPDDPDGLPRPGRAAAGARRARRVQRSTETSRF
jgi:choice-of-anchor B domain-containing protein